MKDEDYIKYLFHIEEYLNSEQSFQFKSESFVDTIITNTIGTNSDNK